jgi:hypothetical protein
MYLRLISFAACAWLVASPGAALCDTITLTPTIHSLDSLALMTGVAFDGTSFWIADINKQVVRLNANYAIAQHFSLNGDIAGVASGNDHNIYAMDAKTIWQISRDSGAVKKIPALGIDNCSQEGLAANGPYVWVVNACQVNNGSTDSVFSTQLRRINSTTGERNLMTLSTVGSGGRYFCASRRQYRSEHV